MLSNLTDSESAILLRAIRGIVFFGALSYEAHMDEFAAMTDPAPSLQPTTPTGLNGTEYLKTLLEDSPRVFMEAGQLEVFCFYETGKSPMRQVMCLTLSLHPPV